MTNRTEQNSLLITILVDNPDSWIMPYIEKLIEKIKDQNHIVRQVDDQKDIESGDIAFFLSCEKIVHKKALLLNKHNLVVHPSDLPKGKGWSPLAWQILEGRNTIPITLFEAVEKVDAGRIYFQDIMTFEGHELIEELRSLQGKKTIDLCLDFIQQYPNINGKEQEGSETFYPRRRPDDSKVNPNRTIAELFNNFRVADNTRYPVYFEHKGYRYLLKIEKSGKIDTNKIALTSKEI